MTNQILHQDMKIKINVDVFIAKEDEYFVAYCPALELSGYGDTEKKALKSFEKEVDIFIEETHRRGTLEKYLLKNGWRLQQNPKIEYDPPHTRTDKLIGLINKKSSYVTQQVNIPVC